MAQIIDGLGDRWAIEIALIDDGPFASEFSRRGHRVRLIGRSGRLGAVQAALALRRLVARTRPDLIHANGLRPAAIAALAMLGIGVPIVWFKPDFARDGRVACLLAQRCRQVVGMSHSVLTTFRPGLDSRLFAVPAGVPDLDVDRSRARALVETLAGGRPVVCLSGRLCPGKGQRELIAIAAGLARETGAHCLMLGGEDTYYPGYEQELRALAGQLTDEGTVTFLGHRDDGVEIIAGSDLLVMPSLTHAASGWQEGFGLVAAEAMWVGTPVVAYANGALPEVIGDCGLIVAEGDRDALLAALLELFGDPAKAEALSVAGKQRARESFRLERAVAMMEERYSAVVEGSR